MTALQVTAITDLILAGETLVLGISIRRRVRVRYSAMWFWSGVLLLLGLAALAGGVDHGWFEPRQLARYGIQRTTWLLLGLMTLCLLMTTAKQFLSPHWHRAALVMAFLQFAVNSVVVLRFDTFLVVVLNYAPVMLLFLGCNIGSRKGSWQMIIGLLIQSGASVVQSMGVDTLSPLDHNGLYHVISMVAVVFLYLGGKRLAA